MNEIEISKEIEKLHDKHIDTEMFLGLVNKYK